MYLTETKVSINGMDTKKKSLNTHLHRLHVLSIRKVNAFSIDKPVTCQGTLNKFYAMTKGRKGKEKLELEI
jgi:hypothetical protein